MYSVAVKSKNPHLGNFQFFVLSILILIITAYPVYSQRSFGFADDFESGSLERHFVNNQDRPPFVIWGTETKTSYNLSEENGVLKIKFTRLEGMGAYDHFTYNSFRARNVSSNPRIQIDIKSDVAFTLTASPVYSMEPPTFEYLGQEVPGDNQWHTCTFELTLSYYSENDVNAIDFYFDRGKAEAKTGNIEMDNFRTAWRLIHVTDLKAEVNNAKNIHLRWNTSDVENTSGYKIFRSNEPEFKLNENTYLTKTEKTEYNDNNLDPYKHYFYKVIAIGTDGDEYFSDGEVSGETYLPGKSPEISVKSVNSTTVKKYEKFEVSIDLKNVGIENPFDPADIDVYAEFTTPSRKKIKINGFYDNYNDADQWKVRFSPNETGEYSYRLFVVDAGGKGESQPGSFQAIESQHHGWIRPSTINPHYFVHDDGTSYYGVGVYSPWQNNMQRFENFAEHKANLFALWDITYGGFVNGTGLIEEELGRYNQLKCGRIDSMISILEERNIKMMYAIWPHDLFSETVWAAEWKNNPYSQLIDVDDVYSDSLIWEYQKQKYRYMIARFAHSRSWGIWELINEMNGTDGWAHGRHQECFDWVAKCDKFFEENDPYNHPVTASFSGGFTEYREELYKLNDIPNIHMYPAQGWPMKYPEDKMRSAMFNYAWASKRFWDNFEKPAIFGEAGAGLAFYQTREPEYHISYHNQIWASLSNGLAATPIWWDYPVLTEGDWDQLNHLSEFIADIDFANKPFKPLPAKTEGADLFILGTGEEAFGWVRSFESENISNENLEIEGMKEDTYKVTWVDTWTGKEIKKTNNKSEGGKLNLKVPKMLEAHPDVAFKIRK
ncbi:MAG: DUF5060 domain-containing protein [Prolixibacteraceae bacterium]|nr:DUF5060 domain-containing protein [Prolixibacteraceae bacterium]